MNHALRATVFILAVTLCGEVFGGAATTRTWTGGSLVDSNWNTPANWGASGVPNNNDNVIFPLGAARKNNVNNISNLKLNIIQFDDSGYVLSGNQVNMSNPGGGGGIIQTVAGMNTIAFAIDNNANNANDFSVTNANGILLLSGVVSGNKAMSVSGSGTIEFSGANTYNSTTTINSPATLVVSNNTGLGVGSFTTVNAGGTVGLKGGVTIVEPISISGAGVGSAGALNNVSGNNTYSGTLTVAAASTIGSAAGLLTMSSAINNAGFAMTFTGAGNTTITSVISGTGGLTKNGTGTLTLTNANTYSGVTTVNAGILNIQNNTAMGSTATTTTVNSGGTLQVQGGLTNVQNPLVLSGAGAASATGALDNLSGNNKLTGTINLAANSTISSDAGTMTLTGVISGASNLTTAGAATILMNESAANTYTGTTTVTSGTLQLQDTGGLAIPGALTIGDNSTAVGSAVATVQLLLSNEIATTSAVTVASDGKLDLNNLSNTVASLTMQSGTTAGGAVTTGTGTLTLGGNVTLTPAGTGAVAATISGKLDEGGATRTFAIAQGTAAPASDLTVSAVISGAGGAGIIKTGVGTLTLSGANSYTGSTAINAGTVALGINNALPNTAADNVTIGTAATTATLAMSTFSDTINSLTLTGAAVTGTTGTMTIANNNFTTNASSRTSTFSAKLAINGAGPETFAIAQGTTASGIDASVSGVISGAAPIVKNGLGTLQLSGSETYTGTTTVNAGILQMDGSLAGGAGLTTVNNTATLIGTGTVQAVTVAAGGAIEPGDLGATGILTANGVAQFTNSASLFDVLLNGTGATVGTDVVTGAGGNYDQLRANSTVNLNNATLNIFLGGSFSGTGSYFTIINNTTGGPINGTFNGLPEGALVLDSSGLQGFTISYVGGVNNNDVVLHQVPILLSTMYNEAGGGLGSLGGVQAGDTVTLTFSVPIIVSAGGAPISNIGVPVTGDSWSTSTIGAQGPTANITVTLAGSPLLTPAGTYSAAATSAGSPTGVFMAASTNMADPSGTPIYTYPLAAGLPTAAAIAASVDLGPGTTKVAVQWGDDYTIVPKNWALGVADTSDVFTASTTFIGGLVLRNSGTAYSHFDILCDTATTPSGWTLATPAATAAGPDKFSMLVDPATPITSGGFSVDLSAGAQRLANGVYSGQTRTFDLQFTAPSALTVGVGILQTLHVTVVMSAP